MALPIALVEAQHGTGTAAIRVGIHFGPVIRAREDIFGDAVNVAARMLSLAKHGEAITSEELVRHYLDRIVWYDRHWPSINSLIAVSETALELSRELDAWFVAVGQTGPLHGIPVIVKDNYDTRDLPTTNGILALKHSVPPDDAYQVRRVREAGAIILPAIPSFYGDVTSLEQAVDTVVVRALDRAGLKLPLIKGWGEDA